MTPESKSEFQRLAARYLRPPEPEPRRRPGFRPAKLTDQQVIEIRYRWNSLDRVEDIARDYSITPAYVSQIGTLKRRASVPEVTL